MDSLQHAMIHLSHGIPKRHRSPSPQKTSEKHALISVRQLQRYMQQAMLLWRYWDYRMSSMRWGSAFLRPLLSKSTTTLPLLSHVATLSRPNSNILTVVSIGFALYVIVSYSMFVTFHPRRTFLISLPRYWTKQSFFTSGTSAWSSSTQSEGVITNAAY